MVTFGIASLRRVAVLPAIGAALLVVACGGSATNPPVTPTPTPSTPTGPPSAQATLVGTGGLNGPLTVTSISCSEPSLDGSTILIFAKTPAPGVSATLTLQAGTISIEADAGAGTSFTARTFTGSGISGFDAARGAQLSGSLTETQPPSSAPGSIGTITSISGSVACNNQQPGSSTVTLSGTTPTGKLSGGISPVRVGCTGTTGALTIGVTMAGTTPELVDMFGGTLAGGTPTPNVSLILAPGGASQPQHYTASGAGVATATPTGVHFNADAVEDGTSGASAITVHISGDVVCGSSATPSS
jgi:hypothetical protein